MSGVMELSSVQTIEMAVFNAASFTGGTTWNLLNGASSYQYFTGNGFQYDIKILKMYNGTTVPIILSYTQLTVPVLGVPTIVFERDDFLPVGGTLIIDFQANHADNSAYGAGTKNGRQGQLIWGNAAAGTGNLYISGFR